MLKRLTDKKKIGSMTWVKHEFYHQVNIYLFKVKNRNSRKRSEICSKFIIRRHNDVVLFFFFVNFEHISLFFLVFLLLNLSK